MSSDDRTPSFQANIRLVRWLAIVDALAIVMSLVGAALLHDTVVGEGLRPPVYAAASAVVLAAQLIFFRLVGLYDLDEVLAGTREYARIVLAATYNLFLIVGVSYFLGGLPLVSRLWVLFVWLLVVVTVAGARFAGRRVVRRLRRRGGLRTRVLVVGGSASGVSVARELSAAAEEGVEVGGFLDEYAPLGRELLPGIRVVGRPADFARNPTAFDCDECVLVAGALPYERLEELTNALVPRSDVSVRMTVGSLNLLTHRTLVAQRSRVPLLALRRAEIVGVDALLKRLFDVLVAIVALVYLAPFALAAILIALARRRTPIVRAEEIFGRGGRAIRLPLLTHTTSELLPVRGVPAFLGVLAGRLSIVGPRPQSHHGARTPLTLQLTAIKPGLTGPWRLSGADASVERQARDDLTYIRSYSTWEDVRIVWQSLRRSRGQHANVGLARWQTTRTWSAATHVTDGSASSTAPPQIGATAPAGRGSESPSMERSS
ncbi:MAG: sugar transferase [Solirubrobacteraceae bacterium]